MVSTKIIAKMIDHSLLRPEMTEETVIAGCKLALQLDTASVCVRPCDIRLAADILRGSSVLVCTVIGFPHGTQHASVKLFEAEKALLDGAVELDMVMNYSQLISGHAQVVADEIKAIVDLAHSKQAIVKVILENCYLEPERIEQACRICEAAGADFVKTSTGFGSGGAELDDIRLMRKTCSPAVRVKAAGGIRSLDSLLDFRRAGADRIGATATAAILEEAAQREAEGSLA